MEGEASQLGASAWANWLKLAADRVGRKWNGASEAEAKEEDLCDRLRIDEWGALMLVSRILPGGRRAQADNEVRLQGQEKHFGDSIHPLPLPGSYLWSNMIMQCASLHGQLRGVFADRVDLQATQECRGRGPVEHF